ncbi:hypothetical protein BD626DRAFT_492922 [Schizophyllum amplum]|uniref:Uncharacterized protein n=1 Tax=Schizophyllum amplum TaxID=97359 RepID=A0A550CGN7_9AGAR|nr:hypothetical protein BD626DRAFT_492922 [Auriculariopsis ampla]
MFPFRPRLWLSSDVTFLVRLLYDCLKNTVFAGYRARIFCTYIFSIRLCSTVHDT